MNVDNQILLHVKAGHLPLDALLQLLLKKKPNAIGFAIQNIHEGNPDLAITQEDATNLSFDDLKTLFDNAKEWPLTAYFGGLKEGYKPEDIQPFVIKDGNDNPFMSLFLEGTMVGNDDPSDHTEHYNYVNGLLIPKILEWCEDFEGDVEKILAKVRGDLFKKEFMGNVGHRAVLHMMPVEGDSVNLGKNEIGEDTDWGWISQKIEAVKEVKVEAPVQVEAKAGRFGWGKKPQASVPAVAPKVDEKGIHHIAEAKAEGAYPAKPSKSSTTNISARPPAWTKSNDDVKLWYDIVGGAVHPQWKKRLPCIVQDFEAAKIDNLHDFKSYAMGKKLKTTGATSTSAGKVPEATAVADKKAITGAAGDPALPIIAPKQLEKVLEFVSKHLDTNSKEIVAPKIIQEMEEALPKFSEAVGLDFMETINWPVNGLVGLGKEDLMALVCYAVEWRSKYRALKTGQLEAGSNVKVTKTGEGTVKTESIAAPKEVKPAAVAAKSSRFGWGGKKAA
jgi:hypothetical protein